MTTWLRRPGALVALALVVSACTASGSPQTIAAPPTEGSAPSAPSSPPTSADPIATAAVESALPDRPTSPPPPVIDAAWAQLELTDVASGQTFRIADFAGRTVIIEPMAIWCPNCLAQQADVQVALAELDPDRVTYLALDVDPNETADALARYQDQNRFGGTYAIAGRELSRALAEDFGDQVLNPPATPMIVIGTDGQVTLADFGHKSPEAVTALAREHGA